jgi:DNA processing protein
VDPGADRRAWLVLAAAAGVGPRTCGALVRAFGGVPQVLVAPRSRLSAVPGVGPVRAQALADAIRAADPAAMETEAADAGLAIVTPADAGFPPALRDTVDPPAALWVRGRWRGDGRPCVAVVGTRGASAYGLRIARLLGEGLARAGVVVVSGLARGIDGAAHAGALAGGGPTVAVLGCGADVVYPPEHAGLATDVAANGALLSEHPPGTSPHPGHFPRRNRVVACLARVTVVVEAGTASGALVTARLAAEAGRDVLAVPGPVDRGTHAGCHRLLRDGATLCEGLDDVLAVLGRRPAPIAAGGDAASPPSPPPPPGPALVVWNVLDADDPLDLDAIALRTGLSPDAAAVGLTLLEVDRQVVRVPGVGARRAR